MEPTIWESADRKITFVQGDGYNIKMDGETATIIIKDIRGRKLDLIHFLAGVLAGAAITIISFII